MHQQFYLSHHKLDSEVIQIQSISRVIHHTGRLGEVGVKYTDQKAIWSKQHQYFTLDSMQSAFKVSGGLILISLTTQTNSRHISRIIWHSVQKVLKRQTLAPLDQ